MNVRGLRLVMAAVLASGMNAAMAQAAPASAIVQEQRVDHRIVLGGTVVPARQVTIAAQLPGRVELIAGTEGDSFPQNTVLVGLGDDELLAQRRSALAQMANAEASLRNAGVQFTRELVNPGANRPMAGMGMPSMFDQFFSRGMSDMMGLQNQGYERHADLITRETHIQQARSSYMQAQFLVDEIDARLRDAKGKAPFDGVITAKLVEVGDTVQPGQPLLRFADTRVLQIEVEVPSRLMPAIRDGITVPARLDVNDALVNARVAQIFPVADAIRHTVRVKFDLPDTAPAAPGMYAEVMVIDSTVNAPSLPVVPVSALVRRGSLPALFVTHDDGRVELRLVRLGDRIDHEHVSVLAGVRAGERVVLNPEPGMSSRSARR